MQLSPSQSAQLVKSLRQAISGEVLAEEFQRALYATDASLYEIHPCAVVIPKRAADVVAAVQVAAQYAVPITARGCGTSLSGQSIGPGIVLDFSKYLNRILDLDPVAGTARVEPGVVLDALNARAARDAWQFGPDVATSSRANLGGMIGNNSAVARSILHGKTVDHVIEMDVVLADGSSARIAPLTAGELVRHEARRDRLGHIYREVARIVAANRDEIIARYPRILRRVSGYNLDEFVPECRERYALPQNVRAVREREAARYPGADFNLAKLIVGSEGTLACVTEALVHLVPLPPCRGVVVLQFESLADAVASLGAILDLQPTAAELLDGEIVRMARRSLEYRHYLDFVQGEPESLMLVEFSASSDAEVAAAAATLCERLRGQHGLTHVLTALEKKLCDHVWACRKAALPLLMGVPGPRKPVTFVEDAAVDPRRLSEFVARFREILARAGTTGAFYGHASVGCLHIRPLLDVARSDDLELLRRISREVAQLVQQFGGAMSGEHGDGMARSYLNEELFGAPLYQAFCEIKTAFDPTGLLNPGKIVEGPSPTDNLRSHNGHAAELPTVLDFSREGGLAAAAEMCNGAGVCRKRLTGTMCPSFMATGDERHSTRGRANALRLVLAGALPPAELTGQALYETFDLCLQCKACKAECPSNVDVAKLKVEFLNHYHRAHGIPRAARLMANVATLNRWGSRLAPLSNWLAQRSAVRDFLHSWASVDRRRPLPRFERDDLRSWLRKRTRRSTSNSSTAPRGEILLLDDCLTSFCEPQIGRAACEVLERSGHRVQSAGIECCGRAMISQGLLSDARELVEQNVTRLDPLVSAGRKIVGVEPSCVLTLVDEYPDIVRPALRDAARRMAQAAHLVEDYLAGVCAEGDEDLSRHGAARISFASAKARALLHGHCHQRALVGLGGTQAALGLVPGVSVQTLDSGCCGMAGSFGYEHYDLSLQIGERVLLPAVRAADAETTILAPGFSCRHQILHATGRQALHPIEFLCQHLPALPQL